MLLFEPGSDLVDDPFLVDSDGVVEDKVFVTDLVQPFLVFIVYLFKVIQGDGALTLPGPLLDPFGAYFRRTLNVDDPEQIDYLVHFDQSVVHLEVNGVLSFV